MLEVLGRKAVIVCVAALASPGLFPIGPVFAGEATPEQKLEDTQPGSPVHPYFAHSIMVQGGAFFSQIDSRKAP